MQNVGENAKFGPNDNLAFSAKIHNLCVFFS